MSKRNPSAAIAQMDHLTKLEGIENRLTLFRMLQSCVRIFFDCVGLGEPAPAHFVKAPLDTVKSFADSGELSIHVSNEESDQRRIEQHRNTDCQIELLVR